MRRLATFGLVGVAASLIHFLLATILLEWLAMSVFLANVAGFAAAFMVSYLGHYHLTFRSAASHATALGRFVMVALAGFAINNICLAVLTLATRRESAASLAASILVAAAAVYFLSGRWAFMRR